MTFRNSSNLKARLAGSTAMVATLAVGLMGQSAVAQDADADESIEEVVVTGSRIKRADLASVSPVSVVSSADINLAGNINVEQTLNELPSLTPNTTSTTNNGGTGIASIDLRELGANRTLVLQNGRRLIGADDQGRVDINAIPAPLIERVEVLTGGASAIYGSDAIAGVVNFIMRDDFEGIEITGQYNMTERGDSDNRTIGLTMGGNFADGRGNVVVHASFTDRQATLQEARPRFAGAPLADFGGGEFTPFGSSNVPGSRVTGIGAGPNGEIVLPDGSFAVDGLAFDENGNPQSNNNFRFNFAPFQFLQVPQERTVISTLGHYDINDNVTLYFEGSYASNRVDQELAPNAGGIPPVGALFVPSTNPLINPVALQTLLDNFDLGGPGDAVAGDGIASLPTVNRRFTEGGTRQDIRELNQYRLLAGLRGALSDNWDYDVNYSFARTNFNEILTNRVSNARIQQGLNATTDANGNAVCIDPTGGCVPLSIFGIGSVSEAAAAFISPTAIRSRFTEQNIVSATVSGTVEEVDFGAGPLGMAFGGEYREERAADIPDSLIRSGELGAGNSALPTQGGFDVWEIYGEAIMPLVSDQPGIERLDLELAGRVSDYSTAGGVFTWSAGLQYEPIKGVRFRGGFQRAIRAPNVNELFGGQASGAASTVDPCSSLQVQADEVAFCQQLGVADPTTYLPPNPQIFTTSGSNPNLFEETAESYTVGVVITPEDIPGLEITVDYYDITVEDAITTLNSTTVLDLCVNSRDVNNNFCQASLRNAVGDVEQIFAPNDNVAFESRQGIDWNVNYTFALGEGQMTLNNVGNYTITNESQATPISAVIDCNGIFGGACTGLGNFIAPEWRFNQTVSYAFGDWFLRAQGRVISPIENAGRQANPDGQFAQGEIKVNAYFDMSFTYQVNENVQLTGGVENISDNQPPVLGFFNNVAANTDPSLYNVLGRSYFMGARVTF